ncbi:MAG TPA: surface-adhesin E family protein [Gemmatimonadaceae bacterium]|nr:surface-adhesin E family protein [Gemmatimonadaceae bacterium]
MKLATFLAVLSAASVASPTARAQGPWPVIFRDASVTVALDTAGVERNEDGSYMTRTRWDYAKLHALESRRPYMSMTQTTLLRCTPVRVKRLTESFYSANGAVVREGSMVNPRDIQYMTWDRLKTGSDASKVFSAACSMLSRRNRRR